MYSLGPGPGQLTPWGVSGQQPPKLARVQYQAALPCLHGGESRRRVPALSALLYIVWLLYGNDYDVAVPSVFL